MTLESNLRVNSFYRRKRFGVPYFQAARCAVVLLVAFTALLTAAQKKSPPQTAEPSQQAKKAPAESNEQTESLAVPDNLTLANGELIPVAEIVPRTEAAQKQLQQIMVNLRASQIDSLVASLNDLNSRVDANLKDTQDALKFARSPLQLTEPRLTWTRDLAALESLNDAATASNATLEDLRQQTRSLRETWTSMSSAAVEAKLPGELMQRIAAVQATAESTRLALRQEADKLIQLQVQLSETRTKIENTLEQIDEADATLRGQLFVLDSPPFWSAAYTANWTETKRQAYVYFSGAKSRSIEYLSSRRYKLLLFGLFALVILVIVLRASKRDLSGLQTGVDTRYFACLQHPFAIVALLALTLFNLLFSKVPSELLRSARLLATVPVIWIGFSFVDRRLRPFLVAIAAFLVIDILTLAFIAGTLLRRAILLLLTASMLAGLIYLLRKGGLLRTFLAEEQAPVLQICCYGATLFMLIATLANLVGGMALADLLANGTIVSMYWAIAFYVLCAVLTALTVVFTTSSFGRRSRALRFNSEIVNRKVALYLKLLSFAVWMCAVLVSFQVSTEALTAARHVLYYKWKVGAISLSPFDIVMFVMVLVVSTMIAKFVRFILNEEILPRTSLDSGVGQAGARLTYSAMLIMGVVLALAAAGLELSKLTVLTGAFGVGLGFGMQNLVGNFVSGIIISLERPMKIGDLIEAGTLLGEVTAIGFRSSTVRTFEGADVIVPNSELITKSFVNWSLKDRLRRTDIPIGVAYGTDPNRVLEILTRIVTGHKGVLPTIAPLITFDQFGDSSLNFTVRFWSKLEERLKIRSELNTLINAEFEKNGIVIPFPQRDVHVKVEGEASNPVKGTLEDVKRAAVGPGMNSV